jgi:hypothetical protein
MPYYPTNPIGVRAFLASPGSVTYVLGNRANDGGVMYISSVAIASNVATVGVSAWSGPLPVVGTKITIRGTSQQAGVFNVSNIAVTGVTLNAAGVGTLTFALTGTNLATAADGGTLSFVPQTTGEVVAAGATMPISPAFNQGRSLNNGFYEITPDSLAALPTAATITPQHAIVNEDAAFFDIVDAPVATVAAGAITASGGEFATDAPFVRFLISAVTGTGSAALGVTF